MKCYMNERQMPQDDLEVVPDNGLLRIYFDFEKIEVSAGDVQHPEKTMPMVRCENVDVPTGRSDYGGIVSAIINDRYTADDVQAMVANYEAAKDPDGEIPTDKREEYLNEYAAFQSWRAHAKEIAKKVIAKKE